MSPTDTITDPSQFPESLHFVRAFPEDRSTWNTGVRPETMRRPGLVGFYDLHPNTTTGRKPVLSWERLGPVVRPADELMHRHYLAAMQQLSENAAYLDVRAFYPDEAGLLVAVVMWRPPPHEVHNPITAIGRTRPVMLWIGYNARSTYAAAIAAASNVPGHLLGGRS